MENRVLQEKLKDIISYTFGEFDGKVLGSETSNDLCLFYKPGSCPSKLGQL